MPTITNPGVIPALVTAFLLKDRDKGAGLIETGYSESYSKSPKGLRLYNRADVKAELRRQEEELIRKTGLTKEHFAFDLEEAKRLGMKINQPSAAVSAINTNMRLHGMDQVTPSDATVIVISPPAGIKGVESEVIDNEV